MVVVNVFTEAHPHTFEKCDKEFYSKDCLQKHMADVHDQCEEEQKDNLTLTWRKNLNRLCIYPLREM